MSRNRYRTQALIFRSASAESEAVRFADALGWPCRGEIPADYAHGVPYEVQWNAGSAITLHYLEDDLSNSSYLVVSGDPEKAEATAKVAARHLEFFSFEELLNTVDQERRDREKSRVLVRAALGAPKEFDERLFEIIRISLEDKSPAVREAAIWATSYSPWPQLRGLLRSVGEHDPDRRIRETAQGMLESFNAAGMPES